LVGFGQDIGFSFGGLFFELEVILDPVVNFDGFVRRIWSYALSEYKGTMDSFPLQG
jgi:hypothetical protein